MSWTRRKKRKPENQETTTPPPGNGHRAKQALIEADAARVAAERRWHDVNRVTDEFAAAVERALRGSR